MKCPKCQCENVTISVVSDVREKRKRGCLYWGLIGWWWEPLLWLFFGLWKLIYEIFRKKTKVTTKTRKIAVCQNCGHQWRL